MLQSDWQAAHDELFHRCRGLLLDGSGIEGASSSFIIGSSGLWKHELWPWVIWDIYEWYLLFHCGAVLRGMGTFWKCSVSRVLLGVLLVFGSLVVFVLGFAVLCFCCCVVTPRLSFHLYSHCGNKQSKQNDWWPFELQARTAPAKKTQRPAIPYS